MIHRPHGPMQGRAGPAPRCRGALMSHAKPTIIELDMGKLEDVLRRAEAKQFDDEDYAIVKTLVRVLRLLDDVGRRQERQHRSAAEAALRREHREDGGGGRQAEGWRSAVPSGAMQTAAARRPRMSVRRTVTHREKATAATGPTPTAAPRQIDVPHPSLQRAMPVRSASRARSTRWPGPACWCGSSGQAPLAGEGLPAAEAALQPVRQGLHGPRAGGRGRAEVRRDGRQHDRPVEVRQRDAVQSPGGAAGEPGHSPAGLDPVGHRARRGRTRRAGLRGADPAGGRRATCCTTTTHGQDPGADGRASPASRPWRKTPRTIRGEDGAGSQRSGLFTSGIVSTREGRRIALFFSGRQHAGENLAGGAAPACRRSCRRRSRCAMPCRGTCRAS